MADVVMLGADEMQLAGLRSFVRRQKRKVVNVAKDVKNVTVKAASQAKKGNIVKAYSIAARGAAAGTVNAATLLVPDIVMRKVKAAIITATGKWLETAMKKAGAAALESDACKPAIQTASAYAGALIGAAVGAMGLGVSAAVTTPIATGLVPITVTAIWQKTKTKILKELKAKKVPPKPAAKPKPVNPGTPDPASSGAHPAVEPRRPVNPGTPGAISNAMRPAVEPKQSSLTLPAVAAALLFLL